MTKPSETFANDIKERLNDIYSCEDGWYDGDGKAVPPESRELAESAIGKLVNELGFVPRMYITYDGHISCEYELGYPGPDGLDLRVAELDTTTFKWDKF